MKMGYNSLNGISLIKNIIRIMFLRLILIGIKGELKKNIYNTSIAILTDSFDNVFKIKQRLRFFWSMKKWTGPTTQYHEHCNEVRLTYNNGYISVNLDMPEQVYLDMNSGCKIVTIEQPAVKQIVCGCGGN